LFWSPQKSTDFWGAENHRFSWFWDRKQRQLQGNCLSHKDGSLLLFSVLNLLLKTNVYKLIRTRQNMGMVLVKIKLMPSSPEVNFEEIKQKVQSLVEENEGKGIKFEEEPIAFGLKALIVSFGVDESKELEPLEEALENIEDILSSRVIDMRRAL